MYVHYQLDISDGYRWLPEEHHLLIESILTCIIMTGVAFCLLCKFQLLPDFIKNIYALQKEKGKVITVVDENLEMNMKQPLMSDQKGNFKIYLDGKWTYCMKY